MLIMVSWFGGNCVVADKESLFVIVKGLESLKGFYKVSYDGQYENPKFFGWGHFEYWKG